MQQQETLLNQAIAFYNQGQLDEAAAQCRSGLDQVGGLNPNLLELLGVIEAQLGHSDEALRIMRLRASVAPTTVSCLSNHKRILQQTGYFVETAALCERIMLSQNDLTDDDAHLSAMLEQIDLLIHANEQEAAILFTERVVRLKEDLPERHDFLGKAYFKKGDMEHAAKAFAKAVEFAPDHVGHRINYASVMIKLEHPEEVIKVLTPLQETGKLTADAVNLLGLAYGKLGEFQKSQALYQGLFSHKDSLEPTQYRQFKQHYSTVLIWAGRYEEALICLKEGFVEGVDPPVILKNLGFAYRLNNQLEEAIAYYKKAITALPTDAESHFGLSLCLLTKGEYLEGFKEYEWRLRGNVLGEDDFLLIKKIPHLHLNQLEQVKSGRLLLYSEQGYGDMLQFSRLLPIIAPKVKEIYVYIHDPKFRLGDLLVESLPNIQFSYWPDPIPDHDFHLPLMSLANLLEIKSDQLPPPTRFNAPSFTVMHFQDWLTTNCKRTVSRPLIGLCVKGRASHRLDRVRSLNDLSIAQLFQLSADFIWLEANAPDSKLIEMANEQKVQLFYAQDGFKDFSHSAGLIHHMDAVISVDTAVAHLAAGLGKPVYLLLAKTGDWRWELNQKTSKWYPDKVKLFRQQILGDWNIPINAVIESLEC